MPRVSMLPGNVQIYQYYNDHPPPHFHAIDGEDEAKIAIADGRVIAGELSRRALAQVRRWAADHRRELRVNWDLTSANQEPEPIPCP